MPTSAAARFFGQQVCAVIQRLTEPTVLPFGGLTEPTFLLFGNLTEPTFLLSDNLRAHRVVWQANDTTPTLTLQFNSGKAQP